MTDERPTNDRRSADERATIDIPAGLDEATAEARLKRVLALVADQIRSCRALGGSTEVVLTTHFEEGPRGPVTSGAQTLRVESRAPKAAGVPAGEPW